MERRRRSGREKADEARAKALKKQFIAFLVANGKIEAAKRFEILGSEGCPSTEEMPYLAEMVNGRIELVDLEEPVRPMTTYGDEGPMLFSIAHQNITQNSSYACDHWVLIDMWPNESKE